MESNGNFTEKEMMEDLLATEKQVISSYSTGITETSCTNLRGTLMNNFRGAQDIQYKIFDAMKQRGWYPIKDAPENEVQQLKTEATQMVSELR
ncbi:spore coat protein [Clostridium pasteurianum DSM 525 = ATCC 6013]|jgi:spore coat protein CotF|uniref:Coat F domain protein n=1 Tax=Clostridium pasteurianum DSM 525 = ATCC 6013 TaxID=1262449 RepID=A0A0H3IXI1_CLOPA|nr:spore coat protein [Clostridium pasteurianum]AJA46171.1 spore coat protein [Clostridium pasteurianum DSM 525 = ATCC 6013]AJA50159.1 spore coat protein [Clostridium pasteurianum DSM 525 = ATCC 6013]AOZ73631.1 spore coat protein F [Clostridium pasteurianum DSM 525 = ATCC 6013]AOZ77428.1 spore coat protein F [Clostridium pasteurianum]ELP57761.1 spore coat protein [Clostridium pasteurianum DSM 525 = ATCC 6013]